MAKTTKWNDPAKLGDALGLLGRQMKPHGRKVTKAQMDKVARLGRSEASAMGGFPARHITQSIRVTPTQDGPYLRVGDRRKGSGGGSTAGLREAFMFGSSKKPKYHPRTTKRTGSGYGRRANLPRHSGDGHFLIRHWVKLVYAYADDASDEADELLDDALDAAGL